MPLRSHSRRFLRSRVLFFQRSSQPPQATETQRGRPISEKSVRGLPTAGAISCSAALQGRGKALKEPSPAHFRRGERGSVLVARRQETHSPEQARGRRCGSDLHSRRDNGRDIPRVERKGRDHLFVLDERQPAYYLCEYVRRRAGNSRAAGLFQRLRLARQKIV